jgi:hypothetical protein
MLAYVVVVDSPYLAQADASGAFTIRNVPPGAYTLEAWHEGALAPFSMPLAVGPEGARAVAVRVAGDRRPPSSAPDKYGKPRQIQLGY